MDDPNLLSQCIQVGHFLMWQYEKLKLVGVYCAIMPFSMYCTFWSHEKISAFLFRQYSSSAYAQDITLLPAGNIQHSSINAKNRRSNIFTLSYLKPYSVCWEHTQSIIIRNHNKFNNKELRFVFAQWSGTSQTFVTHGFDSVPNLKDLQQSCFSCAVPEGNWDMFI